jgi:hypothetical protein
MYIFLYLFCNVLIIYLVIFLYRWHNITTFRIVYHRSDLNLRFLYILCTIFVFVDNCIVASCFLHWCDGSHIHGGVTPWRIYGEQMNDEWMNEWMNKDVSQIYAYWLEFLAQLVAQECCPISKKLTVLYILLLVTWWMPATSSAYSSTTKTEATCSSETLVYFQWITRCYIPPKLVKTINTWFLISIY